MSKNTMKLMMGLISNMYRKIFYKGIRCVFLINDLYVNNLITVYKEMTDNNNFHILVVACDKVKTPWSNSVSKDSVSAMLSRHNIKHLVDISRLKLFFHAPLYIFTSTPYDEYFKPALNFNYLCSISRLCHVSYGTVLINWVGEYEEMNRKSFLKNCDSIFVESPFIFPDNPKFRAIGMLKLDEYIYYGRRYKEYDAFTIAWKPRWILEEGYSIQKYVNYFTDVSLSGIIINFISHPLLLTDVNRANYPECFSALNNFFLLDNVNKVDGDDFLDYVLGSDVLVADISSTIAEYLWTEKPIICTNKDYVSLNRLGKEIIDASYCVNNAEELEMIITQLIGNIDHKKQNRQGIFNKLFNRFTDNLSPTQRLLDMLDN